MHIARRSATALLSLFVVGLSSHFAHADAGESIVLLPEKFTLSGKEARQSLLVQRRRDGLFVGQVSADLTFSSSDPSVVEVKDGVALPRGDGRAKITFSSGGKSAVAEVTVADQQRPFRWSFRNHVQSVFTKSGCNSGSCHGAALGKKGFRLSLRGYDSWGDFYAITRQARGRRIVPGDPGRSLILLKPTAAVAHAGGVRFDVGSPEYRVVAEWIAAGTPQPDESDPRIERLEILPEATVSRPGDGQQLVVRAHFSDGRSEDVTRWAKFSSTNDGVATVGRNGHVKVAGHGEAALTAWYLSRVVIATVSAPYPNRVDAAVFAKAPRRNCIDELVLEKLASLNLPPSPRASDAEFLRRAYLDTIGVLPTVEETRAFLADDSADKRDKLIERLLARPEFIDYWTYKWCDLLLVNSRNLKPAAMWSFYHWLKNNVAAGAPWDEMVRGVITARGSTLQNGAANFFDLHKDPLDMAETTTQAFLGLSIGCAKCHNHPLEKWTNSQYYATANLFARVRAKAGNGDAKTIFDADSGDVIQPLTGQSPSPRPLDGQPLPADKINRRAHLAAYITSPENPYFARAIVNRVWANFLGVGLVEKVDDLRLTNPPSNPKLLEALSEFLVKEKFNLKSLMRAILQSETYQRTSRPLAENKPDTRFYSRYYSRRLMAEVLLDAISQVTASPTQFPGYPVGWRALQLPDSSVNSYFLKSFGRPLREITCECERTSQPSMVQVLHLSNGKTINDKLAAKGNRIEKLIAAGATDEKIVEDVFLAALCRPPSAKQERELLAMMKGAKNAAARRELIEDLYWSVLSSRGFLFNR